MVSRLVGPSGEEGKEWVEEDVWNGRARVARATGAAAAGKAKGRGRYGALRYDLANTMAMAKRTCVRAAERKKEKGGNGPSQPTNA